MPENTKPKPIAYIKILIAIVFWGGSFIATKLAVKEVSPVTVIWTRFLIGIIILGIYAKYKKELRLPSRKDGLELAWLGFLGITLHQWLQSSGLVTSEASTTAWIVSTTPIFMALLGWLFFKEKLTSRILAGILLASLGVLLVVTKGDVSSILSSNFGAPGDILILLSSPNWALFSVLSKPILKRFSALKVTFYTLLFGWMMTSVQFIIGRYWVEFPNLTITGWGSIIFLGVFCSALSYIFYNDGVKAFSATQVGVFLYLEPVVASIVAALILNESIVLASIVGGSLIIAGVWIVNRRQNSSPA